MNGKGLAEESKLYRKPKKMYKQNGDNKETFFKGIELASKYGVKERRFVLYRLKQLGVSDMGFDKLNKARIVLGIMTDKDSLHGFVAAVIEASFD